jgi:hypothetical protein
LSSDTRKLKDERVINSLGITTKSQQERIMEEVGWMLFIPPFDKASQMNDQR